jgi:hypothetical protein
MPCVEREAGWSGGAAPGGVGAIARAAAKALAIAAVLASALYS